MVLISFNYLSVTFGNSRLVQQLGVFANVADDNHFAQLRWMLRVVRGSPAAS